MDNLFLIVNFGDRPHARRSMMEAFENVLRDRKTRFHIAQSRSIPHAHELIQQAHTEGYETLIAGGGDGTLHSLLNTELTAKMNLSVLPLGTVNAMARALGMDYKSPVIALHQLLQGNLQPVDVGHVDDRRFLCFAGVGYDGIVSHQARGLIKRLLRRGAFGLVGFWRAVRFAQIPCFGVRVDGQPTVMSRQWTISNIQQYAGVDLFDTDVTSGSFQGFSFNGTSLISVAHAVYEASKGPPVGWSKRAPHLSFYPSFQRAQIASRHPLFLHLDGEPYTPQNPNKVTFQIKPASQPFLCPTP